MKVIWFVAFALMTTTIFGQEQGVVLFEQHDLTKSDEIQEIKNRSRSIDIRAVAMENLKLVGDPRGRVRRSREKAEIARKICRESKIDKKQTNVNWEDFTLAGIFDRRNEQLYLNSEADREKAMFAIDLLEDWGGDIQHSEMAYLFGANNLVILFLGDDDWRIIGTGKIDEPIALQLTEEDTEPIVKLKDRDKWLMEDFFDKATSKPLSEIDPQDRDMIKRHYSSSTYLWLMQSDDAMRDSEECKRLKIEYINSRGGLKLSKNVSKRDTGAIPLDGGKKPSVPDGHVALKYDQPYLPANDVFANPWRQVMIEFYDNIVKEHHPRDRRWTTADGKYSMSGYIDGFEKTQSGKQVILVKDDGKRINVPYAKLSASDRNFCDVYEDMEMFNAPPKPESKQKKVKPKPSKRQPAGFGASNPG